MLWPNIFNCIYVFLKSLQLLLFCRQGNLFQCWQYILSLLTICVNVYRIYCRLFNLRKKGRYRHILSPVTIHALGWQFVPHVPARIVVNDNICRGNNICRQKPLYISTFKQLLLFSVPVNRIGWAYLTSPPLLTYTEGWAFYLFFVYIEHL